jgi:hypothetical protein
MNNLIALVPILFAAMQVISRELVGMIPAVSRDFQAKGVAKGQILRVPVTPPSENQDITPGSPPTNGGTDFGHIDVAITKYRMAKPIQWNGEEELSVGSQLNQMLINQYAQAMRSLVNEAERDICAEAVSGLAGNPAKSGGIYGSAGTTPFASNLVDLAQIVRIMGDNGAPIADRHGVLNTSAGANLRALEKLTNVNQAGDGTLLRQGIIGNLMGFDIRESGGYLPYAPGAAAAAGAEVSANVAKGTSVIPVTALSGALNKGAIVTINSKKYVVTADAAAGDTSIVIAPKLRDDVADETAITVGAQYVPSLFFSRDAILFVARAPAMPKGGDEAKDVMTITDPVSNLSFQVVLYGAYRQTRVEVGMAWGVKTINPEHGVVLLG